MAGNQIVKATTKTCIEFQEASARTYAEARLWIDGRDKYAPRVIAAQKNAAMLAEEARVRLEQLIGT